MYQQRAGFKKPGYSGSRFSHGGGQRRFGRPHGGYGGGRTFGGRGQGRRSGKSPSELIGQYVRRASVPPPVVVEAEVISEPTYFSKLSIGERLKKNIISRGYETLTPIQEKGLPAILEGKDVIGIANTGTGKTAAFLIPLIEKITQNQQYRSLIITPTRELALQIRDELRKFAASMPVYSTLCIGKASMRTQIAELKRNPHVVVGTPGRLKDLINRGVIRPEIFNMFVLDEVDQMLDMGFLEDIRYIISYLPTSRQSLFFSATVSPEINKLIQSFVVNPITVSVKKQETLSHIEQRVIRIQPGKSKIEVLDEILRSPECQKALVFGRTKMGVERLGKELFSKGHKVTSIHGDKPQFKRNEAIRFFKEDTVKVLVATDVAARGLDIPNVTHVINYDVPETYEDYIHRMGRTGRANKTGITISLV